MKNKENCEIKISPRKVEQRITFFPCPRYFSIEAFFIMRGRSLKARYRSWLFYTQKKRNPTARVKKPLFKMIPSFA